MVILLTGSTAFTRSAVAENTLKERTNWRHLAIDGLIDMEASGEDKVEQRDALLHIIFHCAEELAQNDIHLFLSAPLEPLLIEEIQNELGENFSVIHVGPAADIAEMSIDHAIDSSLSSLPETCDLIEKIIKEVEEKGEE